MKIKEVRAWELEHKVNLHHLKRYMRKEQLQKKLDPHRVNWIELEVRMTETYKQAKKALINIQNLEI